jgi:predicted O-methyltransferase YrrM
MMTEDPYASHIPFLTSIGSGITTVLELGPGRYSTALFLNREAFPKVTRVLSIEHNQEWASRVHGLYVADPRWTLVVIMEPLEDYLATLQLDDFDLIFVDHSATWEARTLTIKWLVDNVGRSKVVIHDFEYPSYVEAAAGFPNRIVDTDHTPNTAMVWR